MANPRVLGKSRRSLSSKRFWEESGRQVAEALAQVDGTNEPTLSQLSSLKFDPSNLKYEPVSFLSYPQVWDAVRHSSLVRLLRMAAEEPQPEAFKVVLRLLLAGVLEIDPPTGVFTRRRKDPGRPIKKWTVAVYEAWKAQGSPPISDDFCREQAKMIFCSEYKRATRNGHGGKAKEN